MSIIKADSIIVAPEVTARTIEMAWEQWNAYRARFQTLRAYYDGDHEFSELHTGTGQNRIVSNYCKYVTDVLVGYMLGNEPRYTSADGDTYGKAIANLYGKQDKWETEQEIAEDMSIYGVAYELVYNPVGKSEPNSKVYTPDEAFVAYAGDVERDSVFGAIVTSYKNDNAQTVYHLYIYDTMCVSEWESTSRNGSLPTWQCVAEPVPHGFGRVPLIEYRNSRYMTGDFEGIIPLQDAYNSLLSDRQDNQDSFAQAMLVLSGSAIGMTADEIDDGKTVLKKHKVLQLDDDATAAYLVKTTDESGVQIIQDQISANIHKLAMVPDLSDEQFSGNASGVAMAYKLFGTDQIVSRKQAQMQKGYTRRCKLYDYRLNNPSLSLSYTPRTAIADMCIRFSLNTPEDLSYIGTALTQLTGAGIMSKRTARTLIASIGDPEEETKRVAEESEETADLTRRTYDYDAVTDGDDGQTDTEE